MTHNIFRCYAYRNKDGYYAICLDLLLIVRRDNLDEAVSELREVIIGYLESIMAHDDGKANLIPRPAPLGDWLRYYWLLVKNTIKAFYGSFQKDFLAFNWKAENGKLTYA